MSLTLAKFTATDFSFSVREARIFRDISDMSMVRENPLEQFPFQNQGLKLFLLTCSHNLMDRKAEFHESMNYTKCGCGETLFVYACEYSQK